MPVLHELSVFQKNKKQTKTGQTGQCLHYTCSAWIVSLLKPPPQKKKKKQKKGGQTACVSVMPVEHESSFKKKKKLGQTVQGQCQP